MSHEEPKAVSFQNLFSRKNTSYRKSQYSMIIHNFDKKRFAVDYIRFGFIAVNTIPKVKHKKIIKTPWNV